VDLTAVGATRLVKEYYETLDQQPSVRTLFQYLFSFLHGLKY